MKTSHVALLLITVGVAAGAGYWGGQRAHPPVAAQAAAAAKPVSERKVLFYRNPMGLPDTSPVPKKDSMGMDYVAVYADEGAERDTPAAAGAIRISAEKVQKLGVRVEKAEQRVLERSLRAAGRIEADERRLYSIAPKFEGYVERLHVNLTGQPVARGQALFEVYSPELISAQREYALAVQGMLALKDVGGAAEDGMKRLADASLSRLRNWDISAEQIAALSKSPEAKHTLTLRSPASGIVTEKKAVQGMRFMPGEMLFQIADLSSVWILADVFEQDIARVKVGAGVTATISAYPGKSFSGRVAYIYPTLNADTRTVPFRVEVANPGALLKPGMFAQVELAAADKQPRLTVPESAVIDSGARRIVLVQTGDGRFEPREVKLGARSDRYVEVLEGVREGESVVVAANFLIDAESNLTAAISGMGGMSAPVAPAAVDPHPGH